MVKRGFDLSIKVKQKLVKPYHQSNQCKIEINYLFS